MCHKIKICFLIIFFFLASSNAFSGQENRPANLQDFINSFWQATLSKDLVPTPGEGCPIAAHPNPEHLETLSFFPGHAPTYRSEKQDLFNRVVKRNFGERIRKIRIRYHTQRDLEFAESNKQIFRDENPKYLAPMKTYNFIIDEKGQMDFGEVRDSWEFGVKHIHLAGGRRVLAAGELKLSENEFCQFNLLSGSLTYSLLEKHPNYEDELIKAMKALFNFKMAPYDCKMVDFDLLPSNPPTEENILKLCQDYWFSKHNSEICFDYPD